MPCVAKIKIIDNQTPLTYTYDGIPGNKSHVHTVSQKHNKFKYLFPRDPFIL